MLLLGLVEIWIAKIIYMLWKAVSMIPAERIEDLLNPAFEQVRNLESLTFQIDGQLVNYYSRGRRRRKRLAGMSPVHYMYEF